MGIIENVLRGLLGLTVMMGALYLMSYNRRGINWRLVAAGMLLQFTVAVLVLKVDVVRMIFDGIAQFFIKILDFTNAGTDFLLTPFGAPAMDTALNNFVFRILPTIIFFSAVSSLLYYFGILQIITKGIAWVMSKTMKLTGAESLSSASNIFLGQTEAPLMVKPYLAGMSRSEIMCVMVGGFANIAGSVFASYVLFLGGDDDVQRQFFATHLLTASVMSAPAAIVTAKILYPETRQITLEEQKLEVPKEQIGSNLLDAITLGSTDGLKLAVNVGVMLLVFTALVSMVNYGLSEGIGSWTGLNSLAESVSGGQFKSFNLEFILGILLSPVAWLIGIPLNDTMVVGQLLGMKTAINEFYAYSKLPEVRHLLSERSVIITTYALCGFANFASIGIQIGGISALAPGQRKNLTELGFKAMIGGTVATLFTATIAGMLLG